MTEKKVPSESAKPASGGITVCPKGHQLSELLACECTRKKTGRLCENCYRLINAREVVRHCESCDFDLCTSCWGSDSELCHFDISVNEMTVSFSWTIADGVTLNKKDWIGLYVHGQQDNKQYSDYVVLGAQKNGKGTLKAPFVGYFDLRFFLDNGYEEKARSRQFFAGPEARKMKLAALYTSDSDSKIAVFWEKEQQTSKKNTDWVGLFPVSELDNSKWIDRQFASDSSYTGFSFFSLTKKDTYELRYFYGESHSKSSFAYCGRSNPFVFPRDDGLPDIMFGITEAEAFCDFSGETNELSFKKGDKIRICTVSRSGQWFGECNGRSGWFPGELVTVIKKDPAKTLPPANKDEPPRINLASKEKQLKKQWLLDHRPAIISDWGQLDIEILKGAGANPVHPHLCYKAPNNEEFIVFFNDRLPDLYKAVRACVEAAFLISKDDRYLNILKRWVCELADSYASDDFRLCSSFSPMTSTSHLECAYPFSPELIPTNLMAIASMDKAIVSKAIATKALMLALICRNIKTCMMCYGKEIRPNQKIAAFIVNKNFSSPGIIRALPLYKNVEDYFSGVVRNSSVYGALKEFSKHLSRFECLMKPGATVEERADYCFILTRVNYYLSEYERNIDNYDYETVKALTDMRKVVTKMMLDRCFVVEDNYPLLGTVPIRCSILMDTSSCKQYYIQRGELAGYLRRLRNRLVDMAKTIKGEISPDDLSDKSLAVLASLGDRGSFDKKKEELAVKIDGLQKELNEIFAKGSGAITGIVLGVIGLIIKVIPAFSNIVSFFQGTKKLADIGSKAVSAAVKDGLENSTGSNGAGSSLVKELIDNGVAKGICNNVIEIVKCYLEYNRVSELKLFVEDSMKKLQENEDTFYDFINFLKFYFKFSQHKIESSDVVGVVVTRNIEKKDDVERTTNSIEDISIPEDQEATRFD